MNSNYVTIGIGFFIAMVHFLLELVPQQTPVVYVFAAMGCFVLASLFAYYGTKGGGSQ